MSRIFNNPANTIKVIAKFCFIACLVIAVILFLIGGIQILIAADYFSYRADGFWNAFAEVLTFTAEDYARELQGGYDHVVGGYMGKILCITAPYFALASLLTIPLYAFGCLVEDAAAIKKMLEQKKEDI